jgi:hypothetical protein
MLIERFAQAAARGHDGDPLQVEPVLEQQLAQTDLCPIRNGDVGNKDPARRQVPAAGRFRVASHPLAELPVHLLSVDRLYCVSQVDIQIEQ